MNELFLYIHIPFCVSKCNYCSFYSITKKNYDEYILCLKKYIHHYSKVYKDYKVKTVYFGGGTPSIIGSKNLNSLLNEILKSFDVLSDAEITLEANPETVDNNFFKDILNGGFNRLSIGVQSLNDAELKSIGRIHDSKTAKNAVLNAFEIGFDNISVDLIFALPNQNEASFLNTLSELILLPIKHISCYNLQIEENTKLYNEEKNFNFLNENEQFDLYIKTVDFLKENGFDQYEISNFAKAGYISKHNYAYWQRKNYLGIGPSACSMIDNVRYSFENDINKFINKDDFSFDNEIKLSESDIKFEKIMLGLRSSIGVPLSDIKDTRYLNKLISEKMGKIKSNRFYLTKKGYFLSNSIICDLT